MVHTLAWEPVFVDHMTKTQFHCPSCPWVSDAVSPTKPGGFTHICKQANAHLKEGCEASNSTPSSREGGAGA